MDYKQIIGAASLPLMVSAMLHTGYDDVIEKHRGQVPLAFMRAIAYRESQLDPNQVNPGSKATGLFQITRIALTGYNRANKTTWTMEDIKDVDKNAAVAGWLLNYIIHDWRNHPALQPEWTTERFPALLALGYNAGYSNDAPGSHYAGLGYVVGKMEAAGIAKNQITANEVAGYATILPKATPNLSQSSRVDYAIKVARTFLKMEPKKIVSAPIPTPAPETASGGGGFPWGAVLLVLGGTALIISGKR